MRFTVERDALGEAVTWVARALPTRPVVSVLAGLMLRAEREDQDQIGVNGPGWLTLSCFDYEVSARMRVRADVAEPGACLVPGRLLVEIVRSLPGYPVEFGDDPDGVSVTCGEAAFAVASLPAAEYPDLPDLPQLGGTADGGVLAAAIGQVTPAASRDDTLPMLTAVNVELDAATMTLAATDRYRLAVRELGWTPALGALAPAAGGSGAEGSGVGGPAVGGSASGGPIPGGSGSGGSGAGRPGVGGQGRRGQGGVALLVPARTLADAARMMIQGTPVRIMLRTSDDPAAGARPDAAGTALGRGPGGGGSGSGDTDAMIGFEVGERRLTTRLLAGEFIRYRSRFPEEFGCTADLPAGRFVEAVRRVALVAERGTPVQLSFAPGRVTVGAATQGQARARETVPAEFTGDEPVIAFSPHYLLDGVIAAIATVPAVAGDAAAGSGVGVDDQRVSAAARVRLQFTSASKPAVITPYSDTGTRSDFRYLVVPQRVQLSPGAPMSARRGPMA